MVEKDTATVPRDVVRLQPFSLQQVLWILSMLLDKPMSVTVAAVNTNINAHTCHAVTRILAS